MKTRRVLIPIVTTGVMTLLVVGLFVTLTASDLSAANAADIEAANQDFSPASGLDVRAALPPSGAVGGAGLVEPRERPASLAMEFGGVVDTVHVTEGTRVARGDALVTLRSLVEQAELAAAEADLSAARADVGVTRAEAGAASARSSSSADLSGRTRLLAERGVATPDERDRAGYTEVADRQSATASSSRVSQASARVRAAEARRDAALARLEALTLRAPIDGEVLQVLVLAGENVPPGGVAVVMGDTSVLHARLDIDERDALLVAAGAEARVRIEGAPGEVVGHVVAVGRRVGRKNVRTEDPTDRTDARFVEVVVELVDAPPVPVGIRVEGFVSTKP